MGSKLPAEATLLCRETGQPAEAALGQVLVVCTGGMLACIELHAVDRTFSLVELQPVPGGAAYVAGIMNYAGMSLPVVDLALRLGLPSAPYHLDTSIAACTYGARQIGLIVNDIVGIETPAPADVQLSDALRRRGAAFSASVHTRQGLGLLLDSGWLVDVDLYVSEPQASNAAQED